MAEGAGKPTKDRARGRQAGEGELATVIGNEAADAASELLLDTPIGAPRTPKDFEPLVTTLGGGTLDFTAMLAIADILPVMLAYVDSSFTYRFVNKPLAEWLGLARNEILGRHMREVLGNDAYGHREPMLRAAITGERKFFASEFQHRSRGPVAVQTDYVPWANAGGQVNGIIVLIKDVTEERAAERAIKESEARFRRIANSAPALMWVTRLDRVRDFVNDAYVDFVCGPGCDLDEARTIDWRTRIHPDDVDRIVAESIAGEASLQRFTLEGRYLRHDDEYRWLRSVSQPRFGPDGELVGFIGVALDITLAKEAELELRRLVEERTAQLTASEAQFRAVFEAALEVMVLLEPDGTVLAVNNRRESWRHDNPSRGDRAEGLGSADAARLPEACRDHEEGDSGRGQGQSLYHRGQDGARRDSDRLSRRVGAASAGRGWRDRLPAVRGA